MEHGSTAKAMHSSQRVPVEHCQFARKLSQLLCAASRAQEILSHDGVIADQVDPPSLIGTELRRLRGPLQAPINLLSQEAEIDGLGK